MIEPYQYLTMLLIIWVLIYLLSFFLPFEKYGLEVKPLYMLYKTKRFNDFLSRVANKNQSFWRNFANIGIAVAVVEMSFAIYLLANNLRYFLFLPKEAAPLIPMLPGITIGFRWFPYILIAFGVTTFAHESAHGILSFLEKIPIKSSGLILAPFTFGGFVEPNEEAFRKSSLSSKLRVISVGSLTNMVTGLAILVLITALFSPFSGVLVMTVPENGPAYLAGMRSWDVIYSINDHLVQSPMELVNFIVNIGPNTLLSVKTSRGIRNIVTSPSADNVSRGIIGVQDLVSYHSMRTGEIMPQISYHLYMTLNWSSLLMINVAIFNMLPLFPFDGEAYLYSLLTAKLKKGLIVSRIAINAVSLFLLVANIGLTFINYGLTLLY